MAKEKEICFACSTLFQEQGSVDFAHDTFTLSENTLGHEIDIDKLENNFLGPWST